MIAETSLGALWMAAALSLLQLAMAIASLKTTMTYWQRILILMGFVLLLNIAYYTVLTFLPSYLSDTLGHSTTQSNFTLVVIMLVMMAIINPIGSLSDRVGRKPLLLAACVGYFVLSVPLFLLIIFLFAIKPITVTCSCIKDSARHLHAERIIVSFTSDIRP